jgi:hypothetical protein
LSIAVLFVFNQSPQPVSACNPTAAPPGFIPATPVPFAVWVANAAPRAQLIVEGTVRSTMSSEIVWEVEVHRYFKGHGPPIIQMQFANPCMIGSGARGLLFLVGDSQAATPLEFQAFYPSRDIPVDAALSDTVINVVRQPPTLPDRPLEFGQQGILVWIAILGLTVLGCGWFVWQRRKQA